MVDVFVSYKREDEARALRLVRALEGAGLAVWWDTGLPGGESWRANIERALAQARCVVVLWTRASTGPEGDFVRDEAGSGKSRDILVPVLLEPGVSPPLGFRELQAVDLSRWRGNKQDSNFQDLVEAVRAKLEGRIAVAAQGRRVHLQRWAAITSGGIALAGGICAFALDLFSLQDHLCTIPVGQPYVSDSCGFLGLGHRPTRAARVAFASLPTADCAALRRFRSEYENSPLREVADSRLASREIKVEERWVPFERQHPVLFVPAVGAPAPDMDTARAQAIARAQMPAERLCRNFAATTLFRFHGASPQPQGEQPCVETAGGFVCAFEGIARCDIEEKQFVDHEVCAGPSLRGTR